MEIRNNLSLEDITYIDDDGVQKIEGWMDVPEWERFYMVSNLGRVKSLSREINSNNKTWISKEILLRQTIDISGYLKIVLQKNKIKKMIKIHQLVAMAFLGHKPDGYKLVVDHINNNPLDNRLCNLQVISQRENTSKDRLNKTSKYTGVSKKGKTFRSYIAVRGKIINLGHFTTEEKANEYYQNALKAIENGTEIMSAKRIKTSKYLGIHFCKTEMKWRSIVPINEKRKTIGYFKTEQEAYEARENYIKKLNL
jgi:hypothetical protein